jgi:Zn-dependent membrane protease YugP
MFNISDYFKKFSKIEGDSIAQKQGIAQAVKDVCGIDNVKYEVKKGILYIKGSPGVRMALFTKKAKLLEAVRKESPLSNIFDIR